MYGKQMSRFIKGKRDFGKRNNNCTYLMRKHLCETGLNGQTLDAVNQALLRLSVKLTLCRFVVEQKTKQNNDTLTYSKLTVSKVHG